MGKFRWALVIILLVSAVFIVKRFEDQIFESILTAKVLSPISKTPTLSGAGVQKQYIETASIFSPYWASNAAVDESYDKILYFGVTPGGNGINTTEAGYQNMPKFLSVNAERENLLVLRMLNSQQNFTIIEDKDKTTELIMETIAIAKENNFSGVVLNLEVKALPFDSVISNISKFVKAFHSEAKKNNLHFAITLYGDTFFRVRPFDAEVIAENSDEVMIMAYDFSKAGGNPGPNFPFSGKETYGYDFQTMIDQFLTFVPPEKITVIFGMYGYDWPVDENGKAVDSGSSLTDNQIQQKFITQCSFHNCQVKKDSVSEETSVTYTDEKNARHVVWFEDEASVAKKKAFLKSRGIGSTSYWANSYF